MTTMTEADTSAPDTVTGPTCQSCGSPTWRWRGSVWGYTCTYCIDRHLDEAAARCVVRMAKEREKIARKLSHHNESEPLLAARPGAAVATGCVPAPIAPGGGDSTGVTKPEGTQT